MLLHLKLQRTNVAKDRCFIDAQPHHERHIFLAIYYLKDDTLSIFKCVRRSSGFSEGMFMQHKKLKNPDTGVYFKKSDIVVEN